MPSVRPHYAAEERPAAAAVPALRRGDGKIRRTCCYQKRFGLRLEQIRRTENHGGPHRRIFTVLQSKYRETFSAGFFAHAAQFKLLERLTTFPATFPVEPREPHSRLGRSLRDQALPAKCTGPRLRSTHVYPASVSLTCKPPQGRWTLICIGDHLRTLA